MEFSKVKRNHSEVLHTATQIRAMVDLAEWAGQLLNRHVTVTEAGRWIDALGAPDSPTYQSWVVRWARAGLFEA